VVIAVLAAVERRAAAAQALEPAARLAIPGMALEKGEGRLRAVQPHLAEPGHASMGKHIDLARLHADPGVVVTTGLAVGLELLDEGAVVRIEARRGPEGKQHVAEPGAQARCGKIHLGLWHFLAARVAAGRAGCRLHTAKGRWWQAGPRLARPAGGFMQQSCNAQSVA
jgi:hypothetical protein